MTLPPEFDGLNIQPPLNEPYRYQRMIHADDGGCYPLLSGKGYQVFNTYKRNVLVCGSRKSGKTIAVGNRVARHMWETDGACVAIIAKTAKNAKIGVWKDFEQYVMPGWEGAGFGFKVLHKGTDPTTKMNLIRVSNMHGTVSEIQLHSLDYAWDVADKFKSSRFSLIWLSEADQFEDRIVYDILEDQLRIVGLDYNAHAIYCDTNPPDEGEDHWLYDIFFNGQKPESKFFRKDYSDQFTTYSFGLDDNPFLDPRERENLINKYKHDKVKYERYCLGMWVRDSAAGHFDQVFLPNIHIVGKADTSDKNQWDTLVPHETARFLVTGIDPGTVANHACSFICPRMRDDGRYDLDVFDELCLIGNPVPVKKFAYDVFERVKFWSKWMQDTYKLAKPPDWYHFADNAVAGYDARSNRNDVSIFQEVSNGAMHLLPVAKGQHSIELRIDLTKRLFFDNRLRISAHCFWHIGWARFLKPGRQKGQTVSANTTKWKHTWDGFSYAARALLANETFTTDNTPSTAVGIITT